MRMQAQAERQQTDSTRIIPFPRPTSPLGPSGRRAPRDWSELGRWVLAEARKRAMDELLRRKTRLAMPVAPPVKLRLVEPEA